MKKRICTLLLGLCLISMTACGNNDTQNVESNNIATSDNTSDELSEKADMKDMIPDPKAFFHETEFEMVTSENNYIVYIDYTSEEEWNNYISECENLDFWTEESYRSDYSWYTGSKDGKYQLLLDRYGDKNEYLTIIVKENVEAKTTKQ